MSNLGPVEMPPLSPSFSPTKVEWVTFSANPTPPPQEEPSVKKTACLYFIEEVDTGRIKVGVAIDPGRRLYQMQTFVSSELKLLISVPLQNAFSIERRLHQFLDQSRVRGEWFSADIRWLPDLLVASDPAEAAEIIDRILETPQDLSGSTP
jgi:hypothetical protein